MYAFPELDGTRDRHLVGQFRNFRAAHDPRLSKDPRNKRRGTWHCDLVQLVKVAAHAIHDWRVGVTSIDVDAQIEKIESRCWRGHFAFVSAADHELDVRWRRTSAGR